VDIDVRNLTAAGWILLVASLGVIALVSIPVGQWALETMDRSTLRNWTTWIVVTLSIVGFAAGVASFWLGAFVLARCGVVVRRSREFREPSPYDGWILHAIALVVGAAIWMAFFLLADV